MRNYPSVIAVIWFTASSLVCFRATAAPSYAVDPSSLQLIGEIDALTVKSKPASALPAPEKPSDQLEAEGRFCEEYSPDECIRFFITLNAIAVGNTRSGFVLVDEGKTGSPQFAMRFQDNDNWLSETAVPISLNSRPNADSEYRHDLSLIVECVRRYPLIVKMQRTGD